MNTYPIGFVTNREVVRMYEYIFHIKYSFISREISSNMLKIKELGRNPWSNKNDDDPDEG